MTIPPPPLHIYIYIKKILTTLHMWSIFNYLFIIININKLIDNEYKVHCMLIVSLLIAKSNLDWIFINTFLIFFFNVVDDDDIFQNLKFYQNILIPQSYYLNYEENKNQQSKGLLY